MNGNDFLDRMELADPAFVEEAARMPAKRGRTLRLLLAAAACLCLAVFLGRGLLFPPQQMPVTPDASSQVPPAKPEPPPATSALPEVPPEPEPFVPRPVPEQAFTPYPSLPEVPDAPSAALPVIAIPENSGGGMGFEGYLVHDITDLLSASPWHEAMQLSALPVYRNPLVFSEETHQAESVNTERMRAVLLAAAQRLGLAESEYTVTDNAPTPEEREAICKKFRDAGEKEPPESFFAPTMFIIQMENMKISVDQTMCLEIRFTPALPMPPELCLKTYQSSYEDYAAAAEMLLPQFSALLGMEQPRAEIGGGEYTYRDDRVFSLSFYDDAGSDAARIAAYNFRRFDFCFDDDGKLFLIRGFFPDCSDLIGSYPVISAQEAQALLLSGRYVTSVPYALTGEELPAKTELVYRNESYDPVWIPYYRFYVPLPEGSQENFITPEGFQHYGAYYVPAIPPEYIENLPLWDGHIN